MASKVMTADERDAQLRKIAGELAGKYGVNNVTRRMVAKAAKCSEPLVSSYLGTLDQLKAHAKREARKLGLKPPTGKEEAAIGAKLRAHKPGDKRDTRKRSVKEVKAVKEKKSAKTSAGSAVKPGKRKVLRSADTGEFVTKAKAAASPATTFADTVPTPSARPKPKPQSPNPPERKPTAPPERKTAARPPKLPPIVQPVIPSAVD